MGYPARMNAEIAAYDSYIRTRLERVITCLDGLSEAQLNWRPTVDEGNSPYALASHTLGNARAWVLGIACGRDVSRDRPAEFAATGTDAARLRDDLALLTADIAEALAALDSARLDHRMVPPQVLRGGTQTHEISVRDALIQVVEHASLHLGHLELTRDLALKQA
jgi:hypothetical protein